MKIYVVRHGQTDWNVEGKIQGQFDTNLTEKGCEQAENLRKMLGEVKFDAVFCSPLIRAKKTCEIILNNSGNKVTYEPCLMERDFGVMVGKKDNFMSFWNLKNLRTAEGVESIEDMEKRIFPFIEKIKREYKNGNILIVTHQGTLFIFENYFGRIPDDGDYTTLRLGSCGYRIYDADTGDKLEFGTDNKSISG